MLDQSKMSKGESRRLATIICGREKSPGQASQCRSWGMKKKRPRPVKK